MGSGASVDKPTSATHKTSLADLFCRLPDEALAHILWKFLRLKDLARLDIALCTHHRIRGTFLESLRSNNVTKNESYWCDPIIEERCFPYGGIYQYFPGGIHQSSVELNNSFIRWIVARGICVNTLFLNADESSNDTIAAITNGLPNLQFLCIDNRYLPDIRLEEIVNGLPNLESLCVEEQIGITEDTLKAITTYSKKLKTLIIENVTDVHLEAIANGLPNLESLYLKGLGSRYGHCTGDGLEVLTMGLQKLQSLSIKDYSDEVNLFLDGALTYGLPTLQSLFIYSDGNDISPEGSAAIAYGFPNLQSLKLECGISDDGVVYIATELRNLQSLYIDFNDGGSEKISDSGVTALANGLSNLQSLDLRWVGGRITDLGVTALANGLTNLQSLAITATKMTDKGLSAIAHGLSKLQSLNIECSSEVTGIDLTSVNVNVRELSIDRCEKIIDAGLMAIVSGFPNLHNLQVYGCDSGFGTGKGTVYTDAALIAIANGLPHLKRLFFCEDVSDCGSENNKVTDAGVEEIVNKLCHYQLAELNINGRGITDAAATAIHRRLRYVTNIGIRPFSWYGNGNDRSDSMSTNNVDNDN